MKETIEEASCIIGKKNRFGREGLLQSGKRRRKKNKILTGARDKANKYMQSEIVYNWNGNEVLVDAHMIHDWVIIDGIR